MFLVKFLDSNNVHACGTDYTRIIHLKTIRGVHNRLIKQSNTIPQGIRRVEIYSLDNNRNITTLADSKNIAYYRTTINLILK